MTLKESQIGKFVTDIVSTATSTERIKQLWGIPLYSNAFYLMVTGLLTSFLGFAFWIVVARFYSAADVGLASAAISAMGLVAAFAHLGLGIGLIRFLPHSGEKANSLINTALTIGTLASILGVIIFIAGLGIWSPALLFIRQSPIYLAAFVIFTVVSVTLSLTGESFIGKRRAGFVVGQNLALSVLRLILPVILATFFHSFGIFASWGISLLVALLVSMFLFLPRAQSGYKPFFTINKKVVNEIMHFSFANYIGNLLWGLPATILPIMMLNLLGAEPTAYFYVAWAIANAFSLVSGASSLSLLAEGSYDEGRLASNTWRSLKVTFLILVPAVILLLVIADKLLLLFGSSYSENATTLLRILGVSILPCAVTNIFLSIKRVEKKLKAIVGLTAFVAIATLSLTYLLLPIMGTNGAGIAWLSAQGIIALTIVARWLKGKQHSTRPESISTVKEYRK
jgi:O-antigen/teichoic acid export membrane protein